jgi:uroporphyrinogen-III decarboxylase
MKGRDLFFATLKGNAEEIPFDPLLMHLVASLNNIDYSNHYCENSTSIADAQIKTARFFGLNHIHACTDAYREASAWGVEVDLSAHTPMAKSGTFLSYRDFEQQETPELLDFFRIRTRIDAIKQMRAKAPDLCVMGWIEAPFAELCSLFDMITVMKYFFLKENQLLIQEIVKRVVQVQLEFARLQIEAGADIIGVGDAAISQIGPKNYQYLTHLATKSLFSEIKKKVPMLYHTCGDNTGIDRQGRNMLQLIIETDPDILDIDYQVNLEHILSQYGDRLCIRGNTNTTMLGDYTQPIDRIVNTITQEINIGKGEKRYIYAAGCEWPWAPLELSIRNLSIAKTLVEQNGKRKK